MDREATEKFIQARAWENEQDQQSGRIRWSRHALSELIDEDWDVAWVERALGNAEVIELYPVRHRPLPDCLVLGWFTSDQPFHAVLAVDEVKERLLVVTVYRPRAEEWENGWRVRRE